MIYFDKGNLLLACIDNTRPNIINLSPLPKVKEVCKLQCEVSLKNNIYIYIFVYVYIMKKLLKLFINFNKYNIIIYLISKIGF